MILYGPRAGATVGEIPAPHGVPLCGHPEHQIDSAAVVRRAISLGQTDETTVGESCSIEPDEK